MAHTATTRSRKILPNNSLIALTNCLFVYDCTVSHLFEIFKPPIGSRLLISNMTTILCRLQCRGRVLTSHFFRIDSRISQREPNSLISIWPEGRGFLIFSGHVNTGCKMTPEAQNKQYMHIAQVGIVMGENGACKGATGRRCAILDSRPWERPNLWLPGTRLILPTYIEKCTLIFLVSQVSLSRGPLPLENWNLKA